MIILGNDLSQVMPLLCSKSLTLSHLTRCKSQSFQSPTRPYKIQSPTTFSHLLPLGFLLCAFLASGACLLLLSSGTLHLLCRLPRMFPTLDLPVLLPHFPEEELTFSVSSSVTTLCEISLFFLLSSASPYDCLSYFCLLLIYLWSPP